MFQAVDDRFVVLTRQAPFEPRGEVVYTIIDFNAACGGHATWSGTAGTSASGPAPEPAGCCGPSTTASKVDRWLEGGEASVALDEFAVEVSYRNNVTIRIAQIRGAGMIAVGSSRKHDGNG